MNFEDVNYDYYHATMGRSVIPDEASFNAIKDGIILDIKRMMPRVIPLENDGIAKAVCMMCECEYADTVTQDGLAVASESVGGHSISYDASMVQKNAKSTAEKKMQWLKRYCRVEIGVKLR